MSGIRIADLKTEDVGRGVVYNNEVTGNEDGTITSWNHSYVFVRFGRQVQGVACRPEDLEFLSK